jgi:hypothetical protein
MILKQQHICKMKAERNFYIIQKKYFNIFKLAIKVEDRQVSKIKYQLIFLL